MQICISSGHGKFIRGASGYLDEVDEARKVVERVAEIMRGAGIAVATFHDDTSDTQNENLNTIVEWHNDHIRDFDISVHFNAYQTTSKPMGCEVLYVTQDEIAFQMSDAISTAGALINRGAKLRTDLFFLNSTEEPSVLVEVCFVDSEADAQLYKKNFDAICDAIAVCFGADVPFERNPPPALPSGRNRLDMVVTGYGNFVVNVNGNEYRFGGGSNNDRVGVILQEQGDVVITINGQDFHREAKPIPTNQRGITASVFGGDSDYNVSAYDEDKVLNDSDFYVALPDRFEGGERPKVRVYNRDTGQSAIGTIEDVGPWNIDDPYWASGTRPQAEVCHMQKQPLPDGPNQGKTPSNPAGIDLSPALADKIGVDGLGAVDWEFV